MRSYVFESVIAALTISAVEAAYPTADLAGCEAFAAQFDNTFTGDAANYDFATDAGEDISCVGTMKCPGTSSEATYTSTSPCTFNRKLFVNCFDQNGTTRIRVRTNNLPNHCFTASTPAVTAAIDSDWTVTWQPAVQGVMNYADTDFDTSAKTDEQLCDLQRTASSNMHSSSNYVDNSGGRRLTGHPPPDSGSGPGGDTSGGGSGPGGDTSGGGTFDALSTASGIALSGAYIYNALAGGNVDAVENEGYTLDTCLSHPTPDQAFHYHYWTPCARKGYSLHDQNNCPELCQNIDGCDTDPSNMVMTMTVNNQPLLYTAAQWDQPIALARDGHLIVGPYKEDGSEWGCADRDVCNGAWVGDQYVYVGSKEFPYVVGCWGPGPEIQYVPGCTNNGCGTEQSTTTDTTNGGTTTGTDSAVQAFATAGVLAMGIAAMNF